MKTRFDKFSKFNKVDFAELKRDFNKLANCFFSVMEGDTHRIGEAYKLLNSYGLYDPRTGEPEESYDEC